MPMLRIFANPRIANIYTEFIEVLAIGRLAIIGRLAL